jgi:DNA helicase-2/ATP-dependent DNA helicase PcrA
VKKLMIAAAGAGKTTYLVNQASEVCDGKVLITTFTIENSVEIKKKLTKKYGFIPSNIIVKTWFDFLLNDCFRPYQCVLSKQLQNLNIGFMYIEGGQSALRIPEKKFAHYFTKDWKIYSDKVSKFIIKTHEKNNDLIFNRLGKIYKHIYIDEVQDLSGYDFDVITNLFYSIKNVILVGDPRQCTYSTNSLSKYKPYNKGGVKEFYLRFWRELCELDEMTLCHSHRNEKIICDLSSLLYQSFSPTLACECCIDQDDHLGVYIVPQSKTKIYLKQFLAIQLRLTSRTKVDLNFSCMNMGVAKGLTLERVLLYPTSDMKKWLLDHNHPLAEATRAKFYVGLTRPKLSLGIIIEDKSIAQFSQKFPVYQE